MPEIFRFKNIVFYFYSSEHTPIHVHIKHAGREAVIELDGLRVRKNHGFREKELKLLAAKVSEHSELIEEMWNEHFKDKEN